MKNRRFWLGMLVMVLVIGMTVVGCGGGSSALVGKWALEPGQPTRGNIEDMELLKDGTGIVDSTGVTWKVENGRFYVTATLGAESFGYNISGGTLTLTKDDGTSLKYKKK